MGSGLFFRDLEKKRSLRFITASSFMGIVSLLPVYTFLLRPSMKAVKSFTKPSKIRRFPQEPLRAPGLRHIYLQIRLLFYLQVCYNTLNWFDIAI